MSILLVNGMINTHDNELVKTDLLIVDQKIAAFGQDLSNYQDNVKEVIDLKNAVILPGLIDVHVHFRQPGFPDQETIKTGSLAAAHGGYTQVCAMPNLQPTPDTADSMKQLVAKNKIDGIVKIHQYAPITLNRADNEELVDFAVLKANGAWAFSNDGSGVQEARTMFAAMKQARQVDLPIVAHTEDNSLVHGGVMRESSRAKQLGLPAIPPVAESVQVARDLVLAKKAKCHYHICHISTIETIDLVRQAKQDGVKVTCEITPHHLLLNTDDIPENNAYWKMNPPLATPKEQQVLIKALLDGTIDLIATDHAPHLESEKATDFVNGAFGVVGLDFSFPLMYTNFVKTGLMTLERLIELMSKNPARIFGMEGGAISIGATADLTVFALEEEQIITKDKFKSKSKNTPFLGAKVTGVAQMTFVDGKLVWKNED